MTFTGFDYTDTTVALSLYGATVVSGIALIPTIKKQNIKAVINLTMPLLHFLI